MRSRSVIALAALCCALLMLSLACAPALPPEPQWEKDARALVDHAESMFAKRQYDQAMKTVEGFFATYPASRYGDRALSLAGEIQYTYRNYPRALSYYKQLIERFPRSTLIAEAKYKIGLCYYQLKEYDLAADNLEDRAGITDPAKLVRISEILSAIYLSKGRNLDALHELVYLSQNAPNEAQRSGYRERVRDLIDKTLSEDDLRTAASGTEYPADIALLRLATLEIAKRQYADAADTAKRFLDTFPAHPETARAQMLLAEATAGLSAPRFLIGVLVPQTGPASFFGDHALRGIKLALLNYNTQNPDRKAEVVIKDTESAPDAPPDKAVAGMAELASQGVVAVIGPLLTKEVEAIAPTLEKLQVPVITPTASGPDLASLSPWLFRNALTNDSQAAAAAQYVLSQKLKKIAIIAPDDPYGRDLTRSFTRELGRQVEVLATITYPPDANDFGPYIRKLIAIDLRSQRVQIPDDEQERKRLFQDYTPTFDGLYIPGYADHVGLLLPQLAFYNITGKTLVGSNSWHSQDLLDRAGQYADGAVFPDGFFHESQDPAIKSVVDAYRAAYQENMDILAAQSYDAAALILAQLKDGKETPTAVRDGLLTTKDFPGISGLTSFLPNGEAQKKLFLIRIENRKFTLLAQ